MRIGTRNGAKKAVMTRAVCTPSREKEKAQKEVASIAEAAATTDNAHMVATKEAGDRGRMEKEVKANGTRWKKGKVQRMGKEGGKAKEKDRALSVEDHTCSENARRTNKLGGLEQGTRYAHRRPRWR